MDLYWLTERDADRLLAASPLFDHNVRTDWADRFLVGCYGMWVLTDADNEAALRTYGSAGAAERSDAVMLTWQIRPATEGPRKATGE